MQGSPQGAVISPLLANIDLDPLDKLMAALGFRMVRYADDFVILCRTREDADCALAEVRAWVAANGLTLHPDKTHVGDCRVSGQGFEFLGFRFEAGQRQVRKKSLTKLKDSIRAKMGRSRGDSLQRVIADLNPSLRLVRVLQARPLQNLRHDRRLRPAAAASAPAQAAETTGHGALSCRPSTLAQCSSLANAGLFALHANWQTARQSR